MVDWATGLLQGNAGMIPGQGEGEAESAGNIRQNLSTTWQAAGHALENMPEYISAINPAIPFLSRTLGGLLTAPDLSTQLQEHNARLQEAYRQAGAVTPQQQSIFRLTHSEFMDPIGQQLTGFMGNIRGVPGARMENLFRGSGTRTAAQIAREGLNPAGTNLEMDLRGVSTTGDPAVASAYARRPIAGGADTVFDPRRIARVETSVPAAEVRNVRPSEYAATTEEVFAPNRQPDVLTEGGQTVFDPARERALSLPQSEQTQMEMFFPQESGGAATLRARTQPRAVQTAQRTQNEAATALEGRVSDIGARQDALASERPEGWTPGLEYTPPTPAEHLQTLRDMALEAHGSRASRPMLPNAIATGTGSTVGQPYARAWEAMFPEDMAALRRINQQSTRLDTLHQGQFDARNPLREAVNRTGGEITPPIRQNMNAMDDLYRQFSSGNATFLRDVADMPRSAVQTASQQRIMRDIMENSRRTRTPFWQAVETAHPVAQRVGMRPDQFAHAMRDRDIFTAASRGDPQLERMLADRLGVMQMAE